MKISTQETLFVILIAQYALFLGKGVFHIYRSSTYGILRINWSLIFLMNNMAIHVVNKINFNNGEIDIRWYLQFSIT